MALEPKLTDYVSVIMQLFEQFMLGSFSFRQYVIDVAVFNASAT